MTAPAPPLADESPATTVATCLQMSERTAMGHFAVAPHCGCQEKKHASLGLNPRIRGAIGQPLR